MPDRPLREPSPEEVAAFWRDGAVCVRGVMPEPWLARMAVALERTVREPSAVGAVLSKPAPGFVNDIYMWLADADYRAFAFESPAAHLARAVLGSRSVTFFYDQVFVKEPGTTLPTPWHHDLTFWQVEGEQICSIWMPLDPVTRESSGLEYVRGSHRWGKRYKAISPDYNALLLDSDLEDPPDIEAHRADYELLSWDMEPGDVLIFHPLVLHGSGGNHSSSLRRRALATRWLGDDVVYAPRRAAAPLPPGHGLEPGQPMGGRFFPRILDGPAPGGPA